MIDTAVVVGIAGLSGSCFTGLVNWAVSKNKRYVDQLQIAVTRIQDLEKRSDAQDQQLDLHRNLIHDTVAERDALKITVDHLMSELKRTTDLLLSVRLELQQALIKLSQAEVSMETCNTNMANVNQDIENRKSENKNV